MKLFAHVVCTVFGGSAVILGVIGLLKERWQEGLVAISIGAGMFLLALIFEQTREIATLHAKVDRLLEQGRPRD